ncbi:hypothetical protein [Novipirellula rosea]|uniref:hypothetical protein n=1 Tax=Novipirellula rosea TaxID=1031540 RepID=UPI0031EBAF51
MNSSVRAWDLLPAICRGRDLIDCGGDAQCALRMAGNADETLFCSETDTRMCHREAITHGVQA